MTQSMQRNSRRWDAQVGVALAILLITVSAACHAGAPGPNTASVPNLLTGVQGTLVYAKESALWTLTPSTGISRKLATTPLSFFQGTLAPSPDGAVIVYGVYLKGQRATDPGGVDLYMSS